MRRTALLSAVLGIMLAAPATADAALVFYLTRATFDAANPGLPVETFSAANIAAGTFTSVNPPVDSTTNDGVFSPGDILPGISIGTSVNTLVVLGDGAVTGTTKSVGAGQFSASTNLTFAPGVSAVGTDVFAAPATGPTIAETFEVSVNGASGLLGSTTVSELAGAIAFFGVSSDVPITSITLHDQANNGSTFVDNIAFGTSAAVPEPGSLALAGISLLAFAGYTWRRRKMTGKPASQVAA